MELGIHHRARRFRAGGAEVRFDRTRRPKWSPHRTTHDREVAALEARALRQGRPLRLAAATGVPPRTISRILERHGVPPLSACDQIPGQPIRASRASGIRYERSRPGELVHVDVKRLGRIPDGGGWRVHGRSEEVRGHGIGYCDVHAAVDDHSRLAYAEVLPDEKGATAAAFLSRAAAYFASRGIERIEQVISDNAFAYRHSRAFIDAVASLGAAQLFIKPHCPWQNGKAKRFNRTLATEWAYRQLFTGNQDRHDALAPGLEHYTLNGSTPATGSRPQPYCLQPCDSVHLERGHRAPPVTRPCCRW